MITSITPMIPRQLKLIVFFMADRLSQLDEPWVVHHSSRQGQFIFQTRFNLAEVG
jgi:hypothetical protein